MRQGEGVPAVCLHLSNLPCIGLPQLATSRCLSIPLPRLHLLLLHLLQAGSWQHQTLSRSSLHLCSRAC